MKTQYYTAASLDGFIADAQNSLDWLFQFGEPEGGSYPAFIRDVGAIAMGSTTYEWILNHHINEGAERPLQWPYAQPTWVFTSRILTAVKGADIRFVAGDVLPVHRRMLAEAGGKNIWLVGGGDLVGQFHDQGLLDEVIVQIASVTLGSGAPLLPRRIVTPPLKLTSATVYGDAFAELHSKVTMAKLIYSVIMSLDGYIADQDGNFDWAAPDEELHTFINDLERPVGTYLYGRRMYESWPFGTPFRRTTSHPVIAEFAHWRAADKVVYSRTLTSPSTPRTRVERVSIPRRSGG